MYWPVQSTIPVIPAPREHHPTAFVTWAHSGEDWTEDQSQAWAEEVRTLCIVLRGLGIDVDADFFHRHEPGIDWHHFGPREIENREFTIIAVSVPWKERWEGRNAPDVGAGAAAEANKLHGIFSRDQQEFRNKAVIVELPSVIGKGALPDELRGVHRFAIRDFSPQDLEELLRLLTGQPSDPQPPLGEIPILPSRARPLPSQPTPAEEIPPTRGDPQAFLNDWIDAIHATLGRLPEAQVQGETPFRLARHLRAEVSDLEGQRDQLLLEQPLFDPEAMRRVPLPFSPSEAESKLYTLRATPLTVGPAFRDRVLTEPITKYLESEVLPLLRPAHDWLSPSSVQPFQHGVAVYEQSSYLHNNSVALGAVAVSNRGIVELHSMRETDPDESRRLDLDAQEQMYLRPMLTATGALLAVLEAVGLCRYVIELNIPKGSSVWEGQQAGKLRDSLVRFSGELTAPAAEDEIESHVAACRRQLARAGGLTVWEPENS